MYNKWKKTVSERSSISESLFTSTQCEVRVQLLLNLLDSLPLIQCHKSGWGGGLGVFLKQFNQLTSSSDVLSSRHRPYSIYVSCGPVPLCSNWSGIGLNMAAWSLVHHTSLPQPLSAGYKLQSWLQIMTEDVLARLADVQHKTHTRTHTHTYIHTHTNTCLHKHSHSHKNTDC